jgi:23S rRNA (cytosine1962-C5)-methyltransferase
VIVSITAGDYPELHLRPGREYPLVQAGHPWIFSGAFATLPKDIPSGAIVDVLGSTGDWIARGHLNAHNSLAFRLLTKDRHELIDEEFYFRRIEQALQLRGLLSSQVNAYRLVHAEADFLPGLIVDRYDRWLVTQFHTAGVERQRREIGNALARAVRPEGILARDDIVARRREGLAESPGASLVFGDVPQAIEIREGRVRYWVDPWHGQKTGFFLDQREKRACMEELAPHAASLLNCFSYSAGFALAGLATNPGLRTINVDTSTAALELARRNYQLNGHATHDAGQHEFIASDVNRYLEEAAQTGRSFDIVILDPPAFAKSLTMKQRALRAYEALNARGIRVLAQGGLLLTCSCSGAVDQADFETVVQQALRVTQRPAQILASFGPSLDHPTLPGFSPDRYLKVLLLRVN